MNYINNPSAPRSRGDSAVSNGDPPHSSSRSNKQEIGFPPPTFLHFQLITRFLSENVKFPGNKTHFP